MYCNMIHCRPMQSSESQRVENDWSDLAHTHTEGLQHFRRNYSSLGASLVAQLVKNLPAMQETPVRFLVGKIPRRIPRKIPIPVFTGFPGGSDGREPACNVGTRVQSRAGKIPWRRAWQPTPVSLPGGFPRDREAWRSTVHGVAKSLTWLSD